MPRILIVKTSSMGDVIHNLPVIADIRQHFPQAVIDWVVEESFQDIPALHPQVANVIPVAVRRWRKHLMSASTWQEIRQFRQKLSLHTYDAIIDTQGLLKSALLGLAAQGPRHGQDAASAREPLASRFYQHRHPVLREQHAVTRNRQLAAAALAYPVPTGLPDYGIAEAARQQPLPSEWQGKAYAMALHATSRDSKLWPEDHWVTLGRALTAAGIRPVLPWGNLTEKSRAERLVRAINTAIPDETVGACVLPKLSIAQLAPIMARAQAAIGVDTGLAHLATALQLPTIALYTDTDPRLTGLMAGIGAPAINLGGRHAAPSVEAVQSAYRQITALPEQR